MFSHNAIPVSNQLSSVTDFSPTEVILLPTHDCNLRCIYCYSNGGDSKTVMPLDIAQGSIDWILENAIKKSIERIALGFHGGGEPFMAWDLLQECVRYARRKAAAAGLGLYSTIFTNGCISLEQRKWAVQNFHRITISMDGVGTIQDHYRPFPNGAGSSTQVIATCQYFDQAGMPYDIRMTVTRETIGQLPETIGNLINLVNCSSISIEPLFASGRGTGLRDLQPEPQAFVDRFLQAYQVAQALGVQLRYSGVDRPHSDGIFCGAAGKYFIVNWKGEVSSCYISASDDSPKLSMMRYGIFDRTSQKFILDFDKLAGLSHRAVCNLDGCEECNVGLWCAGDCLAKTALEKDMFAPCGSSRCQINKLLFKRLALERTQLENFPQA